jgi:hypothetical protein
MGLTIRNKSTGVNLEYTDGKRRFVGRNTRMPVVYSDSLYDQGATSDDRELIIRDIGDVDQIIDEVAATTIPVPATMQELHEAIYFFFWRGIRFTGC